MFIEKMTDADFIELINNMQGELAKLNAGVEVDLFSDMTVSDYYFILNEKGVTEEQNEILNKVYLKNMYKKFGEEYKTGYSNWKNKPKTFEEMVK